MWEHRTLRTVLPRQKKEEEEGKKKKDGKKKGNMEDAE
jgi:hypothetical protein